MSPAPSKSVAGAYGGARGIPPVWREGLALVDTIGRLAAALFQATPGA